MIINDFVFEEFKRASALWESYHRLLEVYENSLKECNKFNWMQNVNIYIPYETKPCLIYTIEKEECIELIQRRIKEIHKNINELKEQVKNLILSIKEK